MHDIIRLMILLVNIWYVCSCTKLLITIIYYVFVYVWHYWLSFYIICLFMYEIIGYHNILYAPSCMTLFVNIIYYMFVHVWHYCYHNILWGCMGTCTHTPGTHTHVPKYWVYVSKVSSICIPSTGYLMESMIAKDLDWDFGSFFSIFCLYISSFLIKLNSIPNQFETLIEYWLKINFIIVQA